MERHSRLADGREQVSRDRRGDTDELMTPGEVARLFGVDPKTVTRWADAGKLSALRTLGGHRRYRADEVNDLLDESGDEAEAS